MPKQSRGFWTCDYCGLTFDRSEEASYHETHECRRRIQQIREGAPTDFWHHQPEVVPAVAMAPRLLSDQLDSGSAYDYEPSRRSSLRRVRLMGPTELSHLNEGDAEACRSIELFEVSEHELAGTSERNRQLIGHVGLRCLYCADKSSSQESYVVPSSIESVGDSVRRLAEQHLSHCFDVPQKARTIIERSESTRRRRREGAEFSPGEDQKNRRALSDYCSARCQQAGIVNKFPVNTGMVFQRSGEGDRFSRGVERGVPAQRQLSSWDQSPVIDPRLTSPFPITQQPVPEYAIRPAHLFGERQDPAFGPPVHYGEPLRNHPPAGGLARMDERLEATPMVAGPSQLEAVGGQHSARYHQVPSDNVSSNFPFLQEFNGDWVCKFCRHIPYEHRAHQYLWASPDKTPPPNSFIDYHLAYCQEFNRHISQREPTYEYPEQPIQYGYGAQPGHVMHRDPYIPRHLETSRDTARVTKESRQRNEMDLDTAFYDIDPFPGQPSATPSKPSSKQQDFAIKSGELDQATAHAIDYLKANDRSAFDVSGLPIPDDARLVLEEDRLLLTDYFYFLMKQLRLVRFTEADRRTRGGKREKIQVGYGGLECVHCSDAPNPRKFFWSNVDRLANSFAEIPGHIFKCRKCPKPIRDALLHLKQLHPEQMARLPRGSQKVFFRRMWRRLHDEDPMLDTVDVSPYPLGETSDAKPASLDTKLSSDNSPGTSGSDETVLVSERPSREAAKVLASSLLQTAPPSPSSRILLAIPEDKEWLSDADCFIRRQIEVFCASKADVQAAMRDRKYPVHEGQVGIRCIHCALAKEGPGAKGQAVAYPISVNQIYESVREFQRLHLDNCENLPQQVKSKLEASKGSSSLTSVVRKYYVSAANALGLFDTGDGIRAGAEAKAIGSHAAFVFSDAAPGTSDQSRRLYDSEHDIRLTRKRQGSSHDSDDSPDTKRTPLAGHGASTDAV